MDILILYALSMSGTPYQWGGKNPLTGIDCSGYVSELLKSAGVIPIGATMNAQEIYNFLEPNSSLGSFEPGSLAFYGSSVNGINHVTFVIDPYRVIGAIGGDDTVTDLKTAQQKSAFVKIRPIRYRGDLVATMKPRYATIGLAP